MSVRGIIVSKQLTEQRYLLVTAVIDVKPDKPRLCVILREEERTAGVSVGLIDEILKDLAEKLVEFPNDC